MFFFFSLNDVLFDLKSAAPYTEWIHEESVWTCSRLFRCHEGNKGINLNIPHELGFRNVDFILT